MEVSFGANQTEVQQPQQPAKTVEGNFETATSVPALVQSGAIAKANILIGDVLPTLADVILPRVNVVQNIGQLKDLFDPGVIVFNQATPLFEPAIIHPKTNVVEKAATPPCNITFFGFRPVQFVEKTVGGVRGLIVKSEEAVVANGGTMDYQEWQLKKAQGIKYFQPMMDALVAIRRPESLKDRQDDPEFVYPVDGELYTLAYWALRSTSYTELYKKVLAPARFMGCLREGGFPTWSFNISTFEKPYQGGNRAWIPIATPRARNTPEFMKFVRSVLEPAATRQSAE
jgi:hypothetical protein